MTLNLPVLACAQADGQQALELVTSYNTCLSDCLDKHAPWRYNSAIDDAREKKRKWENMWTRTKLGIYRQLYVTARDYCTTLTSAKKIEYYCEQLQKTNNKNIFRILRSLDVHQMQLPEFCSTKKSCDPFSRFFQDNIDKRLTNLHCHTAVDPAADEVPCLTDSIQVT